MIRSLTRNLFPIFIIDASEARSAPVVSALSAAGYPVTAYPDIPSTASSVTMPEIIFISVEGVTASDSAEMQARIQQIKTSPSLKDAHIFVILPLNETLIQNALDAGASDCVMMPLQMRLLVKRVDNSYQAHSAEIIRQSHLHLLDNSGDAIISINAQERITEWSRAAERIYGYSSDEAIGQHIDKMLPTDYNNSSREEAYEILRLNGIWRGEVVQWTKDKEPVVMLASVSTNYNDSGQLIGLTAINRDITRRKQVERGLQDNQIRLERIYNHTPIMMMTLSPDDVIVDVNHKWLEAMHCEREAVIGRPFSAFLQPGNPELQKKGLSPLRQFWRDGQMRDLPFKMDNTLGSQLDVLIDGSVTQEEGQGMLGLLVLRDITMQRLVEDKLRRSESQMQSVFEAMSEIVMILNHEGRYIRIATDKQSLLLRPAADLIGRTLHEVMPQGLATRCLKQIRRALDEQHPTQISYDLEIKGQTYWFNASIWPLPDQQVVWIGNDITDRIRAELALKEVERRYQDLFENANDAILLIDVQTQQIVEANEQASRQLSYTREELIGTLISEIEVPTESGATISNSLEEHLITEQYYRQKDGRLLPMETSSRMLNYKGRPMILSFARNVSQRKQAEAAEREQRLLAEALRDTAAAFNNTLNLEEVLDLVLHNVQRVVDSTCANIILYENGKVYITRHRGYLEMGFTEEYLSNFSFELDTVPNLQWVVKHKQALCIPDTHAEGVSWVDPEVTRWVRSFLSAPILMNGEVIGFINLDSDTPNHLTPDKAEHLQAFANQAGIAIQNARLFESIQQYAAELEGRVQERTAALSEANDALRDQILERQLIEDELEEERNLLRMLIDNLPDHIYIKDKQARFILANQALVSYLKQPSLEDLLLKNDFDLYDEASARAFYEQERAVIESGQPLINNAVQQTMSDESTRYLLSTKLPMRDNRGNIIGLIGIQHDITELKRAEAIIAQERNQLRTLIDTIPDSIYIKDIQRRYLLANKAAIRMLKANSLEDILGKTDDELNPAGANQADHLAEMQITEQGQFIVNLNHHISDEAGNEYSYLVTKLPLRDAQGNVSGLISVSRDVTELKLAEAQLKQVLTSARCLLWYAIVEARDGEYIWNMYIANEEAAQIFLPLDTRQRSYTDAWGDSLIPEDRMRRQHVFKTHLRFNKLNYSQELRCLQADGELRWLTEDVQVKPLTDGRWSLVGVCTDITQRKQAQENLQAAYEDMEQRVEDRTRELLNANTILRDQIVERKRAEEAERSQRILAEALRDSAAVLNNTFDRSEMLNQLLNTIVSVIPHDAANVMIIEGDEGIVVAARGYRTDMINKAYDISEWIEIKRVRQTNGPFIISDTEDYPNWANTAGNSWIRANLKVPIRLEERIVGVLNLDSRTAHYFTPEHAVWLQAFANQVSTAIHNSRLVEAIRTHAAELEARVIERTAELEHERAQLHAILNAMRDGVVYHDLSGRPQYINHALSQITGYEIEEWVNNKAEKALYRADTDTYNQMWRRINRSLNLQGYWENEMSLIRKDGEIFDAGLVRTEVRDNEQQRIGIVTVLRDISEAKRLEEQKARFIASASHELRTPIANLKTRLYLLKRQPAKFDEHLDVAQAVINWMQKLVEDMFDLARFERGVIVLEREDIMLQKLILDVTRFQQPEAERQQIALVCEMPDEPLHVNVDPYRLTQIITNLVGNAIHYTHENGRIVVRLSVETSQDEQEYVIISVEDNGIGISEEILPQLFQPFFRAHQDNSGAGLGLSISREIVTLLNGSIHAESELGVGSCFVVRLPMRDLQEPPTEQL